ncbi:MAG: DUF4340 domain-containing protein [Acidobacteria bacterium]|nr:DUF4340 domain-containing protein [Acidobacteriota bacterium]
MRKSTLLVVLLAVSLGGAVWYFEFKREKPAEDAAAASKPLFSFKQEEVVALTVARGGVTLALEKRGSGWRITQPLDSSADAGTADALLSSIAFSRISRTFPVTPPGSPEALKGFGLDAPVVALTIKLKSGSEHRLRLGAKDFTGGYVYALVDNAHDAALLPDDVLANSDKPLLEFRDRRIVVFDEETLVRIRVKNAHGALMAAKNAEGKWLVSEPAAMKGKEVEPARMLSALREARASEILDAPRPADRARFARPAVQIELTAKDGAGTKLDFSAGAGEADAYVRSSIGPMLFKVPRPVMDALNLKPDDVIKKEEPKREESRKEENPARKQD